MDDVDHSAGDGSTVSAADLCEKVRQLSDAGRYLEALEELLRHPELLRSNSGLLLQNGRLIVLSDHPGFDLDDALQCYKDAIRLKEDSAEALLEIGWHLLSIDDNALSAMDYFQLAMENAEKSSPELRDCVEGIARCLVEIDSEQEAGSFLMSRSSLPIDERLAIAAKLGLGLGKIPPRTDR